MSVSHSSAPDGRVRAVIEAIEPAVDGGRFPIKRIVGDEISVEADCFTDGHDQLCCLLLHKREDESEWRSTPMQALGNDRWRGVFTVDSLGAYRYTVSAWVDPFLSWRHDFARRVDAEDLRVAALAGAALIDAAAARATAGERDQLAQWARRLRGEKEPTALPALALDKE